MSGLCPFCQIDEEKTRVLKDGKSVVVVLSNPRLMEGHILVIPRRHVEKLSELTEEERRDLFDATIEFQEKILANLALGCDIRQHYRPFQPQSNLKVHHLHVHLQPRELRDELYLRVQTFETDVFEPLTSEERDRIQRLLAE